MHADVHQNARRPGYAGTGLIIASGFVAANAGALTIGAALIGLAGIALVASRFFAPSLAGLTDTKNGKPDSNTYGFGGITNLARNGSPIPIVYGEHLVGGQIVMAFRRATADRNNELFMMIALSEGPVYSIGDKTADFSIDMNTESNQAPKGMTLNDIPITAFKDMKLWGRLGGANSTAELNATLIDEFKEIVTEKELEFELTAEPCANKPIAKFEW